MKTSSNKDVYQIITDLVIEKLEQGVIPWKQPWNNYGPAVNYLSRKPYRGFNQLILNGLHARPFYLTFKQVTSLGGKIRKGSKSIPVTYWNFKYCHRETHGRIKEEELSNSAEDVIIKTAFLKYYRIFNIDDVLDVEFEIPETKPNDNHSIDRCETVLQNMDDCPDIRHKENQAYYNPFHDFINMPTLEQFKSSELFYSVLFHELVHSTGHSKRLNRFEGNEISSFNSSNYSKQELVAEIGASFLNGHTGILNEATLEDSSAYIQGWLRKLRDDKKFVIEASAKAQKAVDYILNVGAS